MLENQFVLIFFDETFRTSTAYPGVSLGALCGIAIPEHDLSKVANDVFHLKRKYFGGKFAADGEIKGKNLLSNYAFKMEALHGESKNLEFSKRASKKLVCEAFEHKF